MARMDHERDGRVHPLLQEAASLLRARRLDRRGFLRAATLLGVGAAGAGLLYHRVFGAGDAGVAIAQDGVKEAAAAPRRGGALRCAMSVYDIKDPATFAWVEMSNQVRHQNEHLTITGADNITRPMLAEGWSASDDLKVWTFTIRQGALWSNGEPLTAAHVAWNIERWLDPELRSSNLGLFTALASVETVDAQTLRLHLDTPMLSVPESFYNYPTAILHPNFSGDVAADAVGTGPYRIVENIPGERCVLKRVARDGWRYWGEKVPHIGPGWVDEIHYDHVEAGSVQAVEAVLSGRADLCHEVGLEATGVAAEAAIAGRAELLAAETAQTGVLRMRVDVAPFDNWRVRTAFQRACDPSAFPNALFGGRGRAGEHHHVSPLHPEYFRLPPLKRDVDGARQLLAEAGHADGLSVTLDVGNTSGAWQSAAAELFRAQAAEIGVDVQVNVVSAAEYQKIWTTTPFGLTQWTHRPLGTMALSLAYRSGVPWNETGYANPEFDTALTEAEAILDIYARRDAMRRVQHMLQRDAVIVQPVWLPVAMLAGRHVKGLAPQPTQYHHLHGVWLDA